MAVFNQTDQMLRVGIDNTQGVAGPVFFLQQEPNLDHFTLESGSGVIALE
jgi:hypothetical protein